MASLGSTLMNISKGPNTSIHLRQEIFHTANMNPTHAHPHLQDALAQKISDDLPALSDSITSLEKDASMSRQTPDSNDSEFIRRLRRSRFGEQESYEEIGQLGCGGNGNCFLLLRRRDSRLRVCKVCPLRSEEDKKTPFEAYLLKDLLPPNDRIVRMHELIMNTHTCQMYFDYYDGGDLGKMIKDYVDKGMRFKENFIWHCYRQLCEAVVYIHTGYDSSNQTYDLPRYGDSWKAVIHGDIKPMNIFLRHSTDSGFPDLVLGDFGNSCTQPGRGLIGTLAWLPPELPEYSIQSDVWGIGAIVHALCHGGRPPIRPLPSQIVPTLSTMEDWNLSPIARECTPLGTEFSLTLDSCLQWNMERFPLTRPSSTRLLNRVNVEISRRRTVFDDWETIASKPCSKYQTAEHLGNMIPQGLHIRGCASNSKYQQHNERLLQDLLNRAKKNRNLLPMGKIDPRLQGTMNNRQKIIQDQRHDRRLVHAPPTNGLTSQEQSILPVTRPPYNDGRKEDPYQLHRQPLPPHPFNLQINPNPTAFQNTKGNGFMYMDGLPAPTPGVLFHNPQPSIMDMARIQQPPHCHHVHYIDHRLDYGNGFPQQQHHQHYQPTDLAASAMVAPVGFLAHNLLCPICGNVVLCRPGL